VSGNEATDFFDIPTSPEFDRGGSMSPAQMIESVTQKTLNEIRQHQDEWVTAQAAARGLTVEQLGELYYLEYQPIELMPEEQDWRFRATQEIRLRRREG
jgi:hypothetical protein